MTEKELENIRPSRSELFKGTSQGIPDTTWSGPAWEICELEEYAGLHSHTDFLSLAWWFRPVIIAVCEAEVGWLWVQACLSYRVWCLNEMSPTGLGIWTLGHSWRLRLGSWGGVTPWGGPPEGRAHSPTLVLVSSVLCLLLRCELSAPFLPHHAWFFMPCFPDMAGSYFPEPYTK